MLFFSLSILNIKIKLSIGFTPFQFVNIILIHLHSFVNQCFVKQIIDYINYLLYNSHKEGYLRMLDRNYFINGITELLILSILRKHDSYAYEITKTIEQNSNGLLVISQNTIYAAIYKLSNDGKISEYSKLVGKRRTRIYYHLEDSGFSYLEELSRNFHNTILGVTTILDTLESSKGDDTNE